MLSDLIQRNAIQTEDKAANAAERSPAEARGGREARRRGDAHRQRSAAAETRFLGPVGETRNQNKNKSKRRNKT